MIQGTSNRPKTHTVGARILEHAPARHLAGGCETSQMFRFWLAESLDFKLEAGNFATIQLGTCSGIYPRRVPVNRVKLMSLKFELELTAL